MLKRSITLTFSILIICSCHMGKVLVVTDPYWNSFSGSSSFIYQIKSYIPFVKSGVMPHFETYTGSSAEFMIWYDELLKRDDYESILVTYPYALFIDDIEKDFSEITVLGGAVEYTGKNIKHVVNEYSGAFYEAGRELYRLWSEEGRRPVVVFWKRDQHYSGEFSALKEGWGEQNPEFLESNLLILDGNSSDRQGKLKSLYNRIDFQNGLWSLFVYAEPALAEVIKTWPYEADVYGILVSQDSKVLPQNVRKIICRNFAGMIEEAARLSGQDSGEKTSVVNAIFKNR